MGDNFSVSVVNAYTALGMIEGSLEQLQAKVVEDSPSFYTINALLSHVERLEHTLKEDLYKP